MNRPVAYHELPDILERYFRDGEVTTVGTSATWTYTPGETRRYGDRQRWRTRVADVLFGLAWRMEAVAHRVDPYDEDGIATFSVDAP